MFTYLTFLSLVVVQTKKPDAPNAPKVLVAVPLGVAPGSTSKVTLRGLRLDTVSEVRLIGDKSSAKLLRKGKVAVPNMQKPEKVGDSEVQLELTLPAEATEATVQVVSPTGTASHALLVARGAVAEKEPNNGFREAQTLTLPALADGAIAAPQDVDVYRFQGKAGQKIVAEVLAARHGSALDGILTLTDERGAILASNDDAEGVDPRIALTLPRDGVYLLSLIDAHDQGGATHVYRLKLGSP